MGEQIYNKFKEDLVVIKKTIDLFELLESFAQESKEHLLNSEDSYIIQANKITEEIKDNRNGNRWSPSILMLYVAGRFEIFMRTMLEETSTEVAKKHTEFSKLPKCFKDSLIKDTSKVIKEPRKYNHGDGARDTFIKNLYENIHNDNLNVINYQCISITESNMRPKIISELFAKIGYGKIMDDICSQANVRQFFGGTDVNNTRKECERKLNEFMEKRNTIAHPSESITWLSINEGKNYIDFFIEFGKAVESVCLMFKSRSIV